MKPGLGRQPRTRPQGSGTWWRKHWYYDIETIPDDERTMPVTISDAELGEHVFGCECPGCLSVPVGHRRHMKHLARGNAYGARAGRRLRSGAPPPPPESAP